MDGASPHTFTPGIYKSLAGPWLSVAFKVPPAPVLDSAGSDCQGVVVDMMRSDHVTAGQPIKATAKHIWTTANHKQKPNILRAWRLY